MHIRLAQHGDVQAIAEIYNQGIEDRSSTFETQPRTSMDVQPWVSDMSRYPVLVVEVDGTVGALVIGGVVMLWAERREHAVTVSSVEEMKWSDALKVGTAQCLAMIPGTSRSGATIIGGLLFGLSRQAATEFSFFVAMPTMIGAAVYSGYKYRELFQPSDLPVFALGFVVSFFFAIIAVRSLLRLIANHSYTVFAWYRIAFGAFILLTWQFDLIGWVPATV